MLVIFFLKKVYSLDANILKIQNFYNSETRMYTVSQKKLCHFYFYCNFGKCWSFLPRDAL